jgi:hypothetical protein
MRPPTRMYAATLRLLARYRVVLTAESAEEARRLAQRVTIPLPVEVDLMEQLVVDVRPFGRPEEDPDA